MGQIVKLKEINALPSCEVAAVSGAHFQHLNGIPIFYALKVSMRDTADTFLVKVPVDIGKQKCSEVNQKLSRLDFIAVCFENLVITKYTFPATKDTPAKTVYSGKATDFNVVSY